MRSTARLSTERGSSRSIRDGSDFRRSREEADISGAVRLDVQGGRFGQIIEARRSPPMAQPDVVKNDAAENPATRYRYKPRGAGRLDRLLLVGKHRNLVTNRANRLDALRPRGSLWSWRTWWSRRSWNARRPPCPLGTSRPALALERPLCLAADVDGLDRAVLDVLRRDDDGCRGAACRRHGRGDNCCDDCVLHRNPLLASLGSSDGGLCAERTRCPSESRRVFT
jgi:hypothetical protein